MCALANILDNQERMELERTPIIELSYKIRLHSPEAVEYKKQPPENAFSTLLVST